MSPSTDQSRQTAAKKAAATRQAKARQRSNAAKKAAVTRELNQRTPLQHAQDYANRALLIPVGAALVARDSVVERVTDVAKPYRTREAAQRKLERDLDRFERRGTTARNRAERQVKRVRTRVERELRQRRARVERTVRQNRTRVEREVRRNRRRVEGQARTLRRQVGTRLDEAVTNGQRAVVDGMERVTSAA